MSALLAPNSPAPPWLTEEDLAEIARARGKHWSVNRERALARDRCCQFPTCSARWELEVHHIKPLRCFSRREEARANALSNLVVLCRGHHRLVEDTVRHLPSAPDRLPDDLDWRVARTLSQLKHRRMRTGLYAPKPKLVIAQPVVQTPDPRPPTLAYKVGRMMLQGLWAGLSIAYLLFAGFSVLQAFLRQYG